MTLARVQRAPIPASLTSFQSFNTTTTGALGSGRLIDYNATALALLKAQANGGTGTVVYVGCFPDYFRWNNLSTATPDAAGLFIVNPTANGASAGRFERLGIANPFASDQTEWVFDAAAGNDQNPGTALLPLQTTDEFVRRWGFGLYKASTAYNFRLLSTSQNLTLNGFTALSSAIYVNGGLTDRVGTTPALASGTADAVIPFVTATNTPTQITCNAFTNWAGLAGKRIRQTSGATINALSWVGKQDTVTTNRTRTFDWMTPVASFTAAPFVTPAATDAVPAAGTTFVVEDVPVRGTIAVNLVRQGGIPRVVIDSLQVAVAGLGSGCNLYGDGSRLTTSGYFQTNSPHQCAGIAYSDITSKTIQGGYPAGALKLFSQFGSSTLDRFWIQAGISSPFTLVGYQSGLGNGQSNWILGRISQFDSALGGGPIILSTGISLYSPTSLSFVWTGSGNTGYLIQLAPGAIFETDASIGTQPIVTSAASAMRFGDAALGGARTAIPALDVATYTYTANRNLSLANIAATVAAGGFGLNAIDPVTGCGFSQH